MQGAGAFFFQGVSLLLPKEASAAGKSLELPLAYTNYFSLPDILTIPAPDGPISCVSIPPEASLPPHLRAIPVRQALSLFADSPVNGGGLYSRLLRAFHIIQWRQESRFCGSCGCQNTDDTNVDSAARICPSCGRMEFPRIAPAIIVRITNDSDKILLAHNKKFAPGLYSLIAGFVEAGENLEAAAVREIREEVNIEICDIHYIASQPWPFPNSLMVGFSAHYASGTIKPDGIEIEDAQWFSREHLPQIPSHGSVSRYLIDRWIAGV